MMGGDEKGRVTRAAIPNRHSFACGAAEGATVPLASDGARVAAGLGHVNLVATGPVVPPGSTMISLPELPTGSLVPAICATTSASLPGAVISAGVAIVYPVETSLPGLAIGYAATGHKEDIEAIVRRQAEEAMRQRGQQVGELRSIAVQHRVEQTGSVFAAVVLCDGD